MRRLVRVRVGAMLLAALWVLLLCPVSARAQSAEPGRVAVEATAGAVAYPDDTLVTEGLAGAAVRYYLSPRWSLGTEYSYVVGENHVHHVLTENVMFDVLAPKDGQPRRVTPFLVVGGGLYQTREQFFTFSYTSYEPAFTAGGGLRVAVTRRISGGVDVRTGWEPHVRVNGFVTVRLGG